jgi:hypothetical protein
MFYFLYFHLLAELGRMCMIVTQDGKPIKQTVPIRRKQEHVTGVDKRHLAQDKIFRIFYQRWPTLNVIGIGSLEHVESRLYWVC